MKNANVVSMIMEQAKTGREVIGTTVSVVPDNKIYKVTAIDKTEGTVTVTEVLDEESEAVADVVVLSNKNARIAHYINNPNEKPVPDVKLSEQKGKNILTFEDGRTINCGQIKVLKVLGGVKGNVLLVTKNANQDDVVDLMVYNVQNDKFEILEDRFTVPSSDIRMISLSGGLNLLVDTLIRDVEEKDSNGNVVGTYKELVFNNVYTVNDSYGVSLDEVYSESGFPLISNADVVEQAGRKDLVIVTTVAEENGKLEALSNAQVNLYRINSANAICELVGTYDVSSVDAKVYLGGASGSAPVITVRDKNKVFITTSHGTLIVDEPAIVTKMADEGYNYFDGVYSYTDEDGNAGARWYYSNNKREEFSFTSVETDRGTLFNLD